MRKNDWQRLRAAMFHVDNGFPLLDPIDILYMICPAATPPSRTALSRRSHGSLMQGTSFVPWFNTLRGCRLAEE
jgi:hypothetical protein